MKIDFKKFKLSQLKIGQFKLDWKKHKWYIVISSAVLLFGISGIIIYSILSNEGTKDEGFENIPTIYNNLPQAMQVVVKVEGRRNQTAKIILRNADGIFISDVLSQNSFFFSGTYTSGLQKLKVNNLILTVPDGYNNGNIFLNCEFSNPNGIGHHFYSGKVAEW